MNSLRLDIVIFIVLLISCKTITMEDEKIIAEIPGDIELIKIPAGVYSSGEGASIKYVEYDYMMMKYPVTNAQYIQFLKTASENGNVNITSESVQGHYDGDKHWPAGIYEFIDFDDVDCRIAFNPPDEFEIAWNWFGNYAEHPVTEVTWFGANAFAEYYGMKLPTKEEWEKAARANTGYDFPWGNDFNSTKVNFKDSGDRYDNDTNPVGFYNGDNNTTNSCSPYGLYDMTGNAWEWTDSWKDQSPGKVRKGGSWQSSPIIDLDGYFKYYELYTWFEHPVESYSPNNSSHDIGFRCVKILE